MAMRSPLTAKAAVFHVLDDPGHGLELIRRVRTKTGGRVRLKQGAVYPALRQLERDGLVRSWKGRPPKSGGRPRTYYELTVKGIREASRLKAMIARLLSDGESKVLDEGEVKRMQDRLRSCAELSAFCMELRRAFLQRTAT